MTTRPTVETGAVPPIHNASTYNNWHCRCAVCKADHAARQRADRLRRAERLRKDPTLAEHGRAATYSNWRCRCDECTEAWRASKQPGLVTKQQENE